MTTHEQNEAAKGTLIVFVSVIVLAFQSISVKLSYAEGVSLIAGLWLRKVMFLPLFWAWMVRRHGLNGLMEAGLKCVLAAQLAGFAGYYVLPLCSMMSLKTIHAGLQTLIIYTNPMFVLLLRAALDRAWPPRRFMLSFIPLWLGLYFAVGGGAGMQEAISIGALYALGAAILFAFYAVATVDLLKKMGRPKFLFHAFMGAFIGATLQALFTASWAEMVLTPTGYVAVAFYSFCSFVPILLFIEGLRRIGAARASMINTLAPLFTMAFSYPILGETLTLEQCLGSLLVLGTILSLEAQSIRHLLKRKPNT